MKLSELKEKFDCLRKLYPMPEFDALDKEFRVRDIDDERIILREIKDRILDQMDEYVKIIEGIVQPDTNLVEMYESRVFSEDEKLDIFRQYKRFMFIERYALQTELEDGDQKVAEFINVSYGEWMKMKEKLLQVMRKLKDSWTEDEDISFHPEYFG